MVRIGLIVAAAASLVFLGWFMIAEIESPGLSFGMALITMPGLLCGFGVTKVGPDGIAKDGKIAGLVALGIALLGLAYLAAFFSPWLIIAVAWFASYVPMAIGVVSAPTVEG